MPGFKKMGDYPRMLTPKLYAAVPKAVFAGIAAGVVANGGASVMNEDTADRFVAREWVLMFDQGVVDAAPPSWVRALAKWSDDE